MTMIEEAMAGVNNYWLGFDGLGSHNKTQTYPKYNIIEQTDSVVIQIAAVGLEKDEIEIKLREGKLTVTGQKQELIPGDYKTKGISSKAFKQTFILANNYKVVNADLQLGILSIYLEKDSEDEYKIKIN